MPRPYRRYLAIPALATLLATPLSAQPSSKVVTATRLDAPVRVDGRLDEPVWARITPVEDFTQSRPVPGGAPTERTSFYVAYDDDALYIAARLWRQDPSRIARGMSRRDGMTNVERFTVTLDPQRDRRTGVGFGISAAGSRSDHRHTQDSDREGRESQFDPVWTAEAVIDSLGWTAEMRIPFSQLRFPPAAEQQWGIQVDRWIPDKNEDLNWVEIPPSETGFISRFATLRGIEGVRSVRPIELLPYAAGDATYRASTAVVNPLDQRYAGRAGLDAKAALGGHLTLDATVNPDFGQVDADPAEVNLSAFETFFDERRPFFTEGSEMLRGNSAANYFYSRRIGAAPRVSVSGDFVDAPKSSAILGATKLTGRLPNRLTVAGLAAVTASERARTYDSTTAVTESFRVEPRTAYGVFRLQQEVGTQASTVGLAMTTVQRDVGSDTTLARRLSRAAYFGSVDWRLRFKQGRYAISGFFGASQVEGDTAAIRRLQQSSVRYFQRPDIRHVTYDPTRTSLTGWSAQLRADKDAGRRFLWGMEVKTESPGFEINDLGRLQSGDDIEYNADLQVRETLPGRFFQNWRIGFDTRGSRNYGGVHTQNNWGVNANMQFKNFWNGNIRSTVQLPVTDDALTRGGPLMGRVASFGQEFRLNSAFGSARFWRVSGGYETDALGGQRLNLGGQVTLRPSDRMSVTVEPNWQQGTDPRQYVTRVDGGTRTFGSRYVFAFVDRTTISTRLRVNYTFTPNLTLEGYGEPFAASGRYSRHGELAEAGSADLREYGTDGTSVTVDAEGERTVTDGADSFTLSNRDFHVLSFRSNMVLRWEWAPGSTFFLVWQQNRRTSEAYRTDVRFRELLETTRGAGDNFLSVKVTYWLPVAFGGR
ncbi:MAG: carbohydrate binding family 9 domain-containing protein [Gemmatimonadales bacterium]|nr:carbohydrate binding family 9 domain-containing protein [Gemmatimonadales bacterium]